MTLGELINELEYYWEKYGDNTPVRMFEFTRSGDPEYPDLESVEYSEANDSIVIW